MESCCPATLCMQHEWLLTEVSVNVERVSCYVRACDSSGLNCSSIPHLPLLVGHTTKHVEELLVISLEVQMPFHSCTWAKNLDGVNITYGTPHHWYHIWSYICMLLVWLKVAAVQNQYIPNNCPCTDESDAVRSRFLPSIGNRSYCESGNPINGHRSYYIDVEGYLYHDDPLWDG